MLDQYDREEALRDDGPRRVVVDLAGCATPAERDATGRLEAWAAERGHEAEIAMYANGWNVDLFDATTQQTVTATGMSVGTDDAPATLTEVIHAALDEWERRHGEKGEGGS